MVAEGLKLVDEPRQDVAMASQGTHQQARSLVAQHMTVVISRAKFLMYINLRTLEDTMTDLDEGLLLSKFLVLLISRIIDADGPAPHVDPQWLTDAQTESLAAEGISLLARYLPQEAAKQVTTAVEPLARRSHLSREQMLLHIGSLGGVIPTRDPNEAPGCCVIWPGRGLVCAR
jgi:hypothetical protein